MNNLETPLFNILCVESEPFAENSYIVWRKGQNDCIVVDPGLDPVSIFDAIEREKLALVAILNTHGHADHIAGNGAMKERFPQAPLVIGTKDAYKLTDAKANLSAGYGFPIVSPPADRQVMHGEQIQYGGLAWEVRDTPGHSKGHVVFVLQATKETMVLGGDVLFYDSVGRTDFPDGDFDELKQSIHTQLFTLPDNTVIYPGHGSKTTVGREKHANPFVGINVTRKWWEM